jgi:aarF domain-containing kinase
LHYKIHVLNVLFIFTMNVKDVNRILKGASIVIDRVVARNRPEMAWRLERARFHLGELFKVVLDIAQDRTMNKVKPDENMSSKSNIHESKTPNFNDKNTNAPAAAPKPVVVDPIGFSKVDETEDASARAATFESNDKKQMRERAVPSTQMGRFMGFGSLAVRMAMGEAVDRASHALSGNTGPRYISDENAERLAESLCRMRGAALKLGQMLSLQDESALPPSLTKALERVKQAADYMPKRQLELQLESQLGADWRSKVAEFDDIPIAAASIGQVHRAKLLDGTEVAMKIQYPGVAESIDSDLMNLKRLVQLTNLLPPGLFIDQIISVASVELKEECKCSPVLNCSNFTFVMLCLLFNNQLGDYLLEAQSQIDYRKHVLADPVLSKHCHVPEVYAELSTARILTTRLVPGKPVDLALTLPQSVRNAIARTVLIATIRELFNWRLVQSDPNYANFLYDHPSRTIHMIDFGAARRYDKKFVDGYMKLVWAASNNDRSVLLSVSKELGFLTGKLCLWVKGMSFRGWFF